jgi:phenylacetate-coenzyme A ligase PaaK-like adenylate-forming protein
MPSCYASFEGLAAMLAMRFEPQSVPAMFEPQAESMPAELRAAVQQERLRGLVDRLLAAGGLQAGRLAEAGVSAGADVSAGDLARLPTTTKQDLWDSYPFGMLAVPRTEVVAVHGSSGSGGRPTLVSYSRADIALWAAMCARALAAAGAGPGSIVHNAYGYGLFTGGLGIHQGAIALGATVVPVSGGMTARQVTLIGDLRPDILTCTPSYAIRLGEALADAGLTPATGLSLKAGIFGAEPWTDEMRTRISELLGVRALDIYGLSEVIGPGVASECIVAADGLHVNEDHFLVEAIDPVSGQPVPDGTPGELVFSTLTKEAMPLLRYRTGDIAALRRGNCPCGRTLTKMSKVTGRKDDMLVIRGVNVFPTEVERILLAEPALASDYLLVVDERDGRRELVACCERITGSSPGSSGVPPADHGAGPGQGHRPGAGPAGDSSDDALSAGLEHSLRDALGVRVRVVLVPPGSVPRTEVGKAVRVRRWSGGEPPMPGLAP